MLSVTAMASPDSDAESGTLPHRLVWLLGETPLRSLPVTAHFGSSTKPAECLQNALETAAPASSRAAMHQCCRYDMGGVVTCANWSAGDTRAGRLRCNRKMRHATLGSLPASNLHCSITPTAPWTVARALHECLRSVATTVRATCRSCVNQAQRTGGQGRPAQAAAAAADRVAELEAIKLSRLPEVLPFGVTVPSEVALQKLEVPTTLNFGGNELRAVLHKSLLQTTVHNHEHALLAPLVGFLLSGTGWSLDARRVHVETGNAVTLHARIVVHTSAATEPGTHGSHGSVWTCVVSCGEDSDAATGGTTNLNVGNLVSVIAQKHPDFAVALNSGVDSEIGAMLLFGSHVRYDVAHALPVLVAS